MNKTDFRSITKSFFSRPLYYRKGRKQTVDFEKFTPARKFEFANFLKFLDPQPGDKLIELGSGYGRFVLPLLNLGYDVTAVDISADGLSALKKEAESNKLDKKLSVLKSDFHNSTYSEEFNKAFCISTFHLLADSEKERINILRNLVKSLKKRGKLLVVEPNPLNLLYYPFYWFDKEVSWEVEKHFLKSTIWNLKRIFRELNLKNINTEYIGFLPLRFIDKYKITKNINYVINNLPIIKNISSFIYISGEKS
ncbi:MAG: class I SAM-dependent methyltransferase [Candidatus Gottesmanbacteria bacterium]